MQRKPLGVSEEEMRHLQEQADLGLPQTPGGLAGPRALGIDLSSKRRAAPEEVRAYFLEDGKPYIEVEGDSFPLLREDETDSLSPEEIDFAADAKLLWDDMNASPACIGVPDQVDLRSSQTAIKNQLSRGTCVCFAALAALEALSLRRGLERDLSEQYANWLFMRFESRDQCDDGMKTTDAARYLQAKGVCLEELYPYEDKHEVEQHCADAPPTDVRQKARYGIRNYVLIDRLGPLGPSIANTDYLECLLSEDHDIVFGLHVAWGHPDPDGVHDIILDAYGNPLRSRGGHAMLAVGFDRSAPIPYFVFKNSWGQNKGVSGYYYLSYDYVRYYAKYGFVILKDREDMS